MFFYTNFQEDDTPFSRSDSGIEMGISFYVFYIFCTLYHSSVQSLSHLSFQIYERTLRSGPEVSFTTEKGNFEIDHRAL